MSVRQATYDIIKGFSSYQTYPLVAPQETEGLYHTYSIRIEPIRTQDGVTVKTVYLTLNSFSNDWSTLCLQADTIYGILEGITGTYDGEVIVSCTWMGEDENYIPDIDKFQITQEYEIKFR